MAVLYVFLARCLFSYIKRSKADDRVGSLDSQISPASKNRAPIQNERAKSLRPDQFLISSPRHGYCDVSFGGVNSFWF